jgi:hypothetical protein
MVEKARITPDAPYSKSEVVSWAHRANEYVSRLKNDKFFPSVIAAELHNIATRILENEKSKELSDKLILRRVVAEFPLASFMLLLQTDKEIMQSLRKISQMEKKEDQVGLNPKEQKQYQALKTKMKQLKKSVNVLTQFDLFPPEYLSPTETESIIEDYESFYNASIELLDRLMTRLGELPGAIMFLRTKMDLESQNRKMKVILEKFWKEPEPSLRSVLLDFQVEWARVAQVLSWAEQEGLKIDKTKKQKKREGKISSDKPTPEKGEWESIAFQAVQNNLSKIHELTTVFEENKS